MSNVYDNIVEDIIRVRFSMRNDKHMAMKLRKGGKSYKQIEAELGVARSTLSGWLSGLKWSQEIKGDLTRRANYITRNRFRKVVRERTAMWERWREEARKEARNNFPILIKDPLFMAGIMLYWGEGDSKLRNCNVRISNTDSRMMYLFTKFLLDICKVDFNRVRAAIVLYPDLNERICKEFWSKSTGIPLQQFTKTQFIQGHHPTKRLSHGVCQVRYGSRQLKEKIYVWLDLFCKKYIKDLAD